MSPPAPKQIKWVKHVSYYLNMDLCKIKFVISRVYKETVEKTRLENDRLCLEAKEGLLECETALVKIAAKEREITNKSDLVARYRKLSQ